MARVTTLRKVQPEVTGCYMEGVLEARGQDNSASSVPFSLPRASRVMVELLGILLGSGNADPGWESGLPSNCLGTAWMWHSWRFDKELLCVVWDKSEGKGPFLQGRKN